MIRNKLIMNRFLQGGVTNKFSFRTRVYRTLRSLTLISASAALLTFPLEAQAATEKPRLPKESLEEKEPESDEWPDWMPKGWLYPQNLFDITTNLSFTDKDAWHKGTGYDIYSKLYYVWEKDDNGHFKLMPVSTYEDGAITINFRKKFGSGGSELYYGWTFNGNGDLSLSQPGDQVYFTGKGSSQNYLSGSGLIPTIGSSCIVGHDNTSKSEYKYDIEYDVANSDTEKHNSRARGGSALHFHTGVQYTVNPDKAGVDYINAAFGYNRIESTDTKNPIAGHGGAVYVGHGVKLDGFGGDFYGNYITTAGKSFGGALYNLGEITTIRGAYIGNYINSTDTNTANGGAISNGGETNTINNVNYAKDAYIHTISGYFIGNYVYQSNTYNSSVENFKDKYGTKMVRPTGYDAIAGAIANYGRIDKLEGVFIGNHTTAGRTANSGVIRNYDREGARAFIGASKYDEKQGMYVADTDHRGDVVFTGIFIGNYAQGGTGDASGGVMRNNGVINGKITGLYVGNYAKTEGLQAIGSFMEGGGTLDGTYDPNKGPNEASEYQYGTYNFVRHQYDEKTDKTTYTLERRGMAYGGVFYNDVKTENVDQIQPEMGDIEATFIDNYVHSKYGEAHGGAIFNQDSVIQEVNGTFTGNSATSVAFAARGGAIFNNTSGYFDQWSGTMNTLGTDANPAQFAENYAQGKLAQGGAIYVSHSSLIDTVYADFKNNSTTSEVNTDADSEYYHNVVSSPEIYDPNAEVNKGLSDEKKKELQSVFFKGYTLYPAAQGGALFVDERGRTKNITGSFSDNTATVTGLGDLAWTDETYYRAKIDEYLAIEGHSKTDAFNEMALAQGGAIYVNQGYTEFIKQWGDKGSNILYNIRQIDADFTKNKAISKGEIGFARKTEDEEEGPLLLTQAKEAVQGGAIYVNHYGTILGIKGDFQQNEARSESTGAVNNKGKVGGYVEKIVQGGAIYVNDSGFIGDIEARTDTGFDSNIAFNSGNTSDEDGSIIKTGGGAIFVSEDGKILDINANFTNNKAYSTATKSKSEYMRGGAILVNAGGSIKDIGNIIYVPDSDGNQIIDEKNSSSVKFENNIAGTKDGEFSGDLEYARGGAIFVSSHLMRQAVGDDGQGLTDDEGKPVRESIGEDGAIADSELETVLGLSKLGSIQNIWADFKNNAALTKSSAGFNEDMKSYAQGGAIFVLNYAEVGDIKGDFTDNYAVTGEVRHKEWQEDTSATRALEWAHGGAIDVAIGGKLGHINGNFIGNYAENSGEVYMHEYAELDADGEPKDYDDDGNPIRKHVFNSTIDVRDGDDMHAKGGALYIAKGATVGNITSNFERNHVKGSGQVRAGALFVSESQIGLIDGNFSYNWADGTTPELTYGGAVRFDGSAIVKLDSDFTDNWTNGSGGALSLTDTGVIYEVRGNFKGNSSSIYGGAVHNLGNIGLRGHLIKYVGDDYDGKDTIMTDSKGRKYIHVYEYGDASQSEENSLHLATERDATDIKVDEKGNPYKNQAGRKEYDGSFTGGFVNSNFLYNTIGSYGSDGFIKTADARGLGGAIYTDKHLFITTTDYTETVMSGNMVRHIDEKTKAPETLRSAIYVDDNNYTPAEGDYQELVIYLVANQNSVLRIDDNIRGAEGNENGFILRMRGYTLKENETANDRTGLIILNNRVEQSYSILDDVRLYVGYQAQTHQDLDYLSGQKNKNASAIQGVKYVVGDEGNDIIREKAVLKEGSKTEYEKEKVREYSTYLDQAGVLLQGLDKEQVQRNRNGETGELAGDVLGALNSGFVTVTGKGFNFEGDGAATHARSALYHQSDVFRDSHLSVRSGTVSFAENTYARMMNARAHEKGEDAPFEDEDGNLDITGHPEYNEAFTEYIIRSLIAYGIDYNYGEYGTADEDVKAIYTGDWENDDVAGDHKTPSGQGGGHYGSVSGANASARFAQFEFGIGLDKGNMYDLVLADKYYYADEFGNPTETLHEDENGNPIYYKNEKATGYNSNDNRVHVVRQMATSDVLTVCAVVKDVQPLNLKENGTLRLDWEKTSKGRVTLNGISISMLNDGWMSARWVKGGEQNGGSSQDPQDNYNLDVYVQLINYVLLNENREPISDPAIVKMFREDMAKATDKTDPESYWNLLRLSDHFDRVDTATAVMKGSDIMADKIELATTVTIDDSIHLVNWRDHLAEWAELDASTEKAVSYDDYKNRDAKDDNGDYTTNNRYDAETDDTHNTDGTKHFYFDQGVYYLNRNINIAPNPTEKNHDPLNSVMWGDHLTFEGISKTNTLNLQGLNLLSLIIGGQEVRVQSLTLRDVQILNGSIESKHDYSKLEEDYKGMRFMQNEGDLILDTMSMAKGQVVINNAGYNTKDGIDATLTVTGITEIEAGTTITTLDYENNGWGLMFINDSTEVLAGTKLYDDDKVSHESKKEDNETQPLDDAAEPAPKKLEQSYIVIKGKVENQDIIHQGKVLDNKFQMERTDKEFDATLPVEGKDADTAEQFKHVTPFWQIVNDENVNAFRDSFSTNTYLDTTTAASNYTEKTEEFKAFQNNSLTMQGGAFNLGHMYTHRLDLRYFNIDGGAVFVDSVVINISDIKDEVKMGGIDAADSHDSFRGSADFGTEYDGGYAGDTTNNTFTPHPEKPTGPDTTTTTPDTGTGNTGTGNTGTGTGDSGTGNTGTGDSGTDGIGATANTETDGADSDINEELSRRGGYEKTGVGQGLIWLGEFKLKGTSTKKLIHVKFVDDQVGYAVKDGMGVANGMETSGVRYLVDGAGVFTWKVTYNDITQGKDGFGREVAIGKYTLERYAFTPEVQSSPVTEMTGSFVSMMKVYEYAFEHADLYAANINESRLANRYAGIVATKGKDGGAVNACPPSTVGLRQGLWLQTYSSSETMPLHNGPSVKTQMYGGLVGGDTNLRELRDGWASVYTLYGGYLGSTQKYDTVKIKQNGAAVGATATFYKNDFYTAFTASIGTSTAEAKGRGGDEDFNILMGGAAARMGYNFRMGEGRYVLQPSLLVSCSVFSVGDYTNAYGTRIEAEPTTVLQFHPFVKLIRNTDCTWKPYATVGYVYNYFGKTKVKAAGIELPQMSVDPYLEYSVGAQRTYADRYTIYGQLTGRNGGRQGFEASAGLRVAW